MIRHGHRVPHIMKVQKSNKMPASLLFFDTETKTQPTPDVPDTERQVLNFGYAFACRYENGTRTREQWCRFTTPKDFFKFVISRIDKERPLYVFAHNLGFDLTIVDFWNWSENKSFVVEYFVISDPPTFIIGRYKGRKIVFIDTLNYWRTSLAKIGESIGLPKLARPTKRSSQLYWERYGKRDVQVLHSAVEKLMEYIKANDLGQFGLSAASMALSTFKHRFMSHEIYIHDNRLALEIERCSYYGGYCDNFFVGTLTGTKVYKLDVNSMYPYVMLSQFPCKLLHSEKNPSGLSIKKALLDKGVIANVEIASTKATYPVYIKGRLCYANGNFTTYLCGPELKEAIYAGHIKRYIAAAFYDLAPIFRRYIEFFWRERQRFKNEGNDVNQYFVKLFMNMLYGKFGQLGYDTAELTPDALNAVYKAAGKEMPECYNNIESILTQFIGQVDWRPIGLNRPLTMRRVNNSIQIKVPNGEHNESFPAIAAYVTSYARRLLFSYIQMAGTYNTFYCDTDSLFCNEKGYRRLKQGGAIHATELGKLKLEGESLSTSFRCPKDYDFDGESKHKGIRRDAEIVKHGVYRQKHFEGIKSVLKRNYQPFIDIRTITKEVTGEYLKGNVARNGWVTPFTLPLEEQDTLPPESRSGVQQLFD